jgi:hypothetical protein
VGRPVVVGKSTHSFEQAIAAQFSPPRRNQTTNRSD